MGPDDATPASAWISGDYGPELVIGPASQKARLDIDPADLPKVAVISLTPEDLKKMGVVTITFWFPPKYYRCHSRKRFVKLLMGMGIQRNDAQYLAKMTMGLFVKPSYQAAWDFSRETYRRRYI